MWELNYKESWTPKNWCFWTVVLEKTESPLDCKEIQPVNPKGNQSWIFIGRTDAEAETTILWLPDATPILWLPDAKNRLIGKDPDAGKDWRQEEKGMTEDEMAGWHHRLNGHGFGWTSGVGDGQGSLMCCSPWGPKESDTSAWLSWTVHAIQCVPFVRAAQANENSHITPISNTRIPQAVQWFRNHAKAGFLWSLCSPAIAYQAPTLSVWPFSRGPTLALPGQLLLKPTLEKSF